MRESIGGTWLTGLIILFMLVFVAFLALTLNYSKAFKMKNEIVTMIEKREGMTTTRRINNKEVTGSIGLINNYMKKNGYNIRRNCPVGSYGSLNLDNEALSLVTNANTRSYYYCVSKIEARSTNYEGKVFYRVNIGLKFNLPIIGDLFTFDISGDTKDITIPADNLNKMR